MSPTAREYGAYMGLGLVIAGAGVDELQSGPRPEPDDSAFIYSGCLTNGLPVPWGGTGTGISLYLEQVAYPEETSPEVLAADEVPALLRDLKRIFNLNTTELADICLVSRPTIYSWRKGGEPGIEKLRRLDTLRGVLLSWVNRMGVDTFSAPRVPDNGGLKKHLTTETLPVERLEATLTSLQEEMNVLHQRRPKSARELLSEHGPESLPEDVQERSLKLAYIDAGRGR